MFVMKMDVVRANGAEQTRCRNMASTQIQRKVPNAESSGYEALMVCSAGACSPLVSLFLLLLFLSVVVPLDGEEHARAEHEKLERNEDYGDPIHHFEYFRVSSGAICHKIRNCQSGCRDWPFQHF